MQAAREAIEQGLVTRRQMENVKTTRRARQRVARLMGQVGDGNVTSLRGAKKRSDGDEALAYGVT